MSVTRMFVAPSMTWLFVRISPFGVRTMPVPAASPPSRPSVVTTSTRPGSTDEAMEETLAGEPDADELLLPPLLLELPEPPPGKKPGNWPGRPPVLPLPPPVLPVVPVPVLPPALPLLVPLLG